LEGSIALATKSRLELRADIDIVFKKLALMETISQEQRALHPESLLQAFQQELVQLRTMLTDESRVEAQEARVEVLETRGSLDAFRSGLKALSLELQKERQARAFQAAEFQSGLRQLQDKLHITVENHGQHQSSMRLHEASMRQLEESLREIEKQTITSARSENIQSARSASELLREKQRVKHTPRSEESFQTICEKLDSFEPSAAKDVSWRRQAVSDVENILDDLSHISPRPTASNSMLPTLATALRLSKAGGEAETL